jgi:tetratricopeptide (TPR) repeat protein
MKSRLLSLFFVLLLSSFLLTGCTTNEAMELSNSLVEEGKSLYENKEYKQAVEKYGEALEQYPANFDAYDGIITILLKKSHFEEAENVANEAAIRVDSEDAATLYFRIGRAYYEHGDYENAEDMYKRALEEEKSFYRAKIGLAELNIWYGDLEQASKELGAIGGGNKKAYDTLLLKAYLTLEDWEKGKEFVNEIDLGEISREETKERARRLKEIYESEELEKDELHKNTYLAKEYINSGYPYLAIEILENKSEDIEEYWDAQYFLGKAYFDYGDYEKSTERLNNAVALDVDDANLFLLLGRVYLFQDDVDKSLKSYERAVSLAALPEDKNIVKEYMNVLIQNNILNSARTTLLNLLEEDDYPWIYILLAEISYTQGNFNRLNEYLRVLEDYADLTRSEEKDFLRYKILSLIEAEEEKDTILEIFASYKKLDEYDPEIFLLMGEYSLAQGNPEEAKELLNRSIELDLEGNITREARKILATVK